MRIIAWIGLWVVAGIAPVAWADSGPADEPTGPILESLDGAPSIEVRGADGVARTEYAGAELREGDRFELPAGSVGRLIFRQSSQALVTGGTRLGVGEEPSDSGDEKIPSLEVEEGEVRTLVDPAPDQPAAPSGRPALRFLIRTRSAVIGVRGTDFVVQADAGHSEVHTMSGTVDVGRDATELRAGSVTRVPANQFVHAPAGGSIAPPRSFDPGEYLQKLHQRHPRLESAWRRAASESHNGKLRQHFEQLHRARVKARRQAASVPAARARKPARGTASVTKPGPKRAPARQRHANRKHGGAKRARKARHH